MILLLKVGALVFSKIVKLIKLIKQLHFWWKRKRKRGSGSGGSGTKILKSASLDTPSYSDAMAHLKRDMDSMLAGRTQRTTKALFSHSWKWILLLSYYELRGRIQSYQKNPSRPWDNPGTERDGTGQDSNSSNNIKDDDTADGTMRAVMTCTPHWIC